MAGTAGAMLEAVLFAAGEPLTKKRLATVLGIKSEDIKDAVAELRASLTGRGITLIETDEELELRTTPETSEVVQKLRENELTRDLGKAGLESLAVILYKGSATRADVDWVRGVNSSQTIRSLLLRGLIERSDDTSDRRRALYKPTVDALAHLGATERSALPRFEEFAAALSREEARKETEPSS
jgi:segregation and condensation protein B